MVSSGTVTSDLNSLTTNITNYSSHVGDLASNWKGPSYDNLSAKAEEFASEYSSSISNGMTAFANAIIKYDEYIANKRAYEVAKSNYDIAVQNKDDSSARKFASEMAQYEKKMAELKPEIESFLSTAASVSLTASALSISSPSAIAELQNNTDATASSSTSSNKQGQVKSTSSTSKATSNEYVASALDAARAIAKDNRHGYSQQSRWGSPNYDCSSYVISCWEEAGVPVKSKYGATYTGNMRKAFIDAGFKCYRISNGMKLQPGDVLLNEGVHTAMYYGDGKIIDATSSPSNGDQIGVRQNSSGYGWQYVLRYEV